MDDPIDFRVEKRPWSPRQLLMLVVGVIVQSTDIPGRGRYQIVARWQDRDFEVDRVATSDEAAKRVEGFQREVQSEGAENWIGRHIF